MVKHRPFSHKENVYTVYSFIAYKALSKAFPSDSEGTVLEVSLSSPLSSSAISTVMHISLVHTYICFYLHVFVYFGTQWFLCTQDHKTTQYLHIYKRL